MNSKITASRNSSFAFIVAIATSVGGMLQTSTASSNEPSKVMHGIRLSDYGDFEKKWKLVTVRFRKDTGELRFTYANDSAWRHLKKTSDRQGSKVSPIDKAQVESYPRGAVFAKVGIKTAEDPAFTSSSVPSGVRRVQFMVRDEKRFADTDGWGYALFDSGGNTFPGDPKYASMACAACHKIVPDRGYVFSQLMTGLAPVNSVPNELGRLKFETKAAGSFPDHVQLQLPPKTENVRFVVGDFVRHVFPGTLDEIRPALAKESVRTGSPAMLFVEQNGGVFYSIVYSTKAKGTCGEGQIEYLGLMNTTEKFATMQTIRFCESEKK